MDVSVRAWARAPSRSAPDLVTIFLPDMHLPLRSATMPELDPDLIPDPQQATCWCHGPIFARIDGTVPQKSVYRAVGTFLSRNPNDWFQLLANTYRLASEDLIRFLDRPRSTRLGGPPTHVLHQLGGLFEVWAGFQCIFHARGIARPSCDQRESVANAGEHAFRSTCWSNIAVKGRTKDAVDRMIRMPDARRTLARRPPHTRATRDGIGRAALGGGIACQANGELPRRESPRAGDVLRRPSSARSVGTRRAEGAKMLPWTRGHRIGWREEYLASAGRAWCACAFPLYAMAHSHVACIAYVVVEND